MDLITDKYLLTVVKSGQIRELEELIYFGATLKNVDSNNDETLMHAAALSNVDTWDKIKYVLENEPNLLNKPNRLKRLPIHAAALCECAEACKFLICYFDLDVNGLADSKLSALHVAAKCGFIQNAKLLLCRRDIDCDIQNINGDTALHLAAKNGHNIMFLLLAKKCSAHVRNIEGFYPSHYLESHVLELCESGKIADVKRFIPFFNGFTFVDELYETCLHKACKGNTDAYAKVALLLDLDLSQASMQNVNGDLPIHNAVRNRDNRVVNVFIDHPKLDVNARNTYGRTILHLASFHCLVDTIQKLCELDRVDINACDNTENSAVDIALAREHNDVIDILRNHPLYKL